jgi:hypothetical protein
MPADEFLTSLDCQNQASQSRLFAQKSPSRNIALQLERLADFRETLATFSACSKHRTWRPQPQARCRNCLPTS